MTWSSATQTVATISGNVATGIAEGSSVITATLNSISGGTTLNVSANPPPPPPPDPNSYTIFNSSAVPATPDLALALPLELGLRFSSEVNGFVTGVRFYKGPSNTGVHVGSLWSMDGQLLAQATFSNETATGWQQADFSKPVAIAPNTTYVISYHTTAGFSYSTTKFGPPLDNPPLHAPVTNNGVYAYAGFPQESIGSNFFVDVVFNTGASTVSLVSIAVTPQSRLHRRRGAAAVYRRRHVLQRIDEGHHRVGHLDFGDSRRRRHQHRRPGIGQRNRFIGHYRDSGDGQRHQPVDGDRRFAAAPTTAAAATTATQWSEL